MENLNIDWASLVLSCLSCIVGAAFSWIIARRTVTKTEMTATIESRQIFKANVFPGVNILVNGICADSLTRSDIIFWNSGFSKIDGSDIVESNKLRIEIPDSAQLYAYVIEKTNDVDMDFAISPTYPLEITFDYCKPGGGIRIAVLHSGMDIFFKGKLKTMGEIKQHKTNHVTNTLKNSFSPNVLFLKAIPIIGVVLYNLMIFIFSIVIAVIFYSKLQEYAFFVAMVTCLLGGSLSAIILQLLQRYIMSQDGPPELRY